MTPKTVSELYPSKWLKANDLNGRTVTITITAVTIEPIRNPRTTKEEDKAILGFGRSKRLILNKTQSLAIADIARSEIFADWPGTAVTLTPSTARNGKPTILITPAPAPKTAVPSAPNPDTGEIFSHTYGNETGCSREMQPHFNSYRRDHDEAVPESEEILMAWLDGED